MFALALCEVVVEVDVVNGGSKLAGPVVVVDELAVVVAGGPRS